MTMPIPATLTSYLPVLLVSVTHNAAPDDSSFDTLPEGQVDYLSHDWKEEDVWRSWRSMTRQKNAIANGMRLENASWRKWWKQRNKLKTINPQTVNWLKDSDVTWLYGPLHIGHDWTSYSQRKIPKLQRKTSADAISGPFATHLNPPSLTKKKPILKRRSISQLLSLPASPFFNQIDSDEDDDELQGFSSAPLTRPPLVHTKSDTHINMRGRPFRKDSPPRIIAEENTTVPPHSESQGTTSSNASGSAGSDQDLCGTSTGPEGPKKKHISFNTFVEQYIAIEKPNVKRAATGTPRGGRMFDAYDDGYDSELGYDGEPDEPSSYCFQDTTVIGSDSEDDDDDVLEIRTASSRSRSNSLSSTRNSSLASALTPDSAATSRPRPPMVRRQSTDREHVTIAPIAPTMLKSTGVGNNLMTLREGKSLESPKDVDLVYVPTAAHYSHPGTPQIEDVYHHRESYFSIGTAHPYTRPSQPRSPAPPVSAPWIPSVGMPPDHALDASSMRRAGSGTFFAAQSMSDSPMQIDDAALEDAYDYFGGPDLGEDFSQHLRHRPHRRDLPIDNRRRAEMARYAEGGAESVTTGRSNWQASPSPSPSPIDSPRTPDADMPVVVVNEVNGAVEERQERSRESSPSRSPVLYRIPEQHGGPSLPYGPSPTSAAVPVPRVSSAHALSSPSTPNAVISSSVPSSGLCSDPALLSPSDGAQSRGRMPHPPSVSGSTTTGSSSYHSSDSRSGSSSRGRSSTRTSSFSDRERSGSRSRSRGTNSPLGSISPTGSAVGIGSGGTYGRRDRDRGREVDPHGSKRRGGDDERGRERVGRRLGDSLSPPSVMSSPSRGSSNEGPYQPYSPVLTDAILETSGRVPSPPSSVSGSSTETASVSTVGPGNAQQTQTQTSVQLPELADRPRLSVHAFGAKASAIDHPIPSPIPEVDEDEQLRSRQPTPVNSPVATFRMAVPAASNVQPGSSSHERSTGSPAAHTWTPAKASPTPAEASDVVSLVLRSKSPPSSPTVAAAPSTAPFSSSRHPSREQRVSLDGVQEQAGTLVNRAAEIVHSARGFFGSIWSSNSP